MQENVPRERTRRAKPQQADQPQPQEQIEFRVDERVQFRVCKKISKVIFMGNSLKIPKK